MRLKTASAEFPNDNDQLHDGAIWGVATPCAAPAPVERAIAVVARLAHVVERAERLVERIEAKDGTVERSVAATSSPERVERVSEIRAISAPLDDGLFTALLDDEQEPPLIEASASPDDGGDVAEAVPAPPHARESGVVVGAARDDGDRLEEAVVAAAEEMGVAREMAALLSGEPFPAESVDARLALMAAGYLHGGRASEKFRVAWQTWVGLVRGDCDDFAACAGSMLDDWCADLLARATGSLEARQGAKRALRARGVAAFGLSAAA